MNLLYVLLYVFPFGRFSNKAPTLVGSEKHGSLSFCVKSFGGVIL